LTFLPNAPSSTISSFTALWVPTASYAFFVIIKKLPKKYPTLVLGSFAFNAEYLDTERVQSIGKVIFVQKSFAYILGIAVSASRSLASK